MNFYNIVAIFQKHPLLTPSIECDLPHLKGSDKKAYVMGVRDRGRNQLLYKKSKSTSRIAQRYAQETGQCFQMCRYGSKNLDPLFLKNSK